MRLALAFVLAGSVTSLTSCSSRFRSAGAADETDETATSTLGSSAANTETTASVTSGGGGADGGSTTASIATATGTSTTGSDLVHCEVGTPECQCGVAGCFLIQGASCTHSTACKTRVCGVTQAATNICCATLCEQGYVCTADGSGCELEGACEEDAERCSAEGNHERCTGGRWQVVAACENLGCSFELTGGCLGALGASCSSDDECGAGACRETTDGNSICCDVSCGDCEVCNESGSDCTDPDHIKPGCNCTQATAFACDDNVPCTDDACDGGRCSNQLRAGYCLIDGKCYDHNQSESGNPCRYCDTTIRDRAWTNSANTVSCDDGAWCNGVDTCDGSGRCEHEFRADRCVENGGCALGSCDEARDSCYRPPSEVCLLAAEFICESSSCGGDVLTRTLTTYCSGSSPICNGNAYADPWQIYAGCTVNEKCTPGTWTCEAVPECEGS